MKKFFLVSALLFTTSAMMMFASSCGTMKGANSIQAISKVANVVSTAKEISNVLGTTLGLNSSQKPSLTNVLTDYITNTNGIASLFKKDKKSYAKQLTSLNTGTLGKINDILTVAQYAKLLGLGGKSHSKSSLLDGLTGGSSLSGSAVNVLSGLLLNGRK